MQYPDRFSDLPAYAFPRLRGLLDAHPPGGDVLAMSIGEPTHPFPDWVAEDISEHMSEFGKYPPNDGTLGLRTAIAGWIDRRYHVSVDPETQIMALNGTREGLYNAAMALCGSTAKGEPSLVLCPNPFYQVYAVAGVSVGATPVFVAADASSGFLPDYAALSPDILNRVSAAYICSPSNPQGAVADWSYWSDLVALAEQYDFRIFADECYAEVYRGEPPTGLLEVAAAQGADPERVCIFHSLSKRSNLPGLRSGFIAGGPLSIARVRQLRAYGGAPLPLPIQHVSERLWSDETHVSESRALYAQKFAIADEIFGRTDGYMPPHAGFFLWMPVDDGETAALKLWRETGVRVLPGAYLGREVGGHNPGSGYLRVALVASKNETERGLTLLRDCLYR